MPSTDNMENGCSGFTLLELIVSMTIISMVVLVLYFAFSIGSRVWDDDSEKIDENARLEAVLRLVKNDLSQAVPYKMNWEKGSISLFAGGPSSAFYVTRNGTGSFSGPGAGLYFVFLYADNCPENSKKCLYLYKSPRPGPEFIRAVDQFRATGELERRHYTPGTKMMEKSIPILEDTDNIQFSYSQDEFIPFSNTGHETMNMPPEENPLPEDHWLRSELPAQARFLFEYKDRKYFIQVPVGESVSR